MTRAARACAGGLCKDGRPAANDALPLLLVHCQLLGQAIILLGRCQSDPDWAWDETISGMGFGMCRLWEQHRKAQARLMETRTEMEQLIDPETGRRFFEPESYTQTYRTIGAKNQNRHEGQSVGEYLYAAG